MRARAARTSGRHARLRRALSGARVGRVSLSLDARSAAIPDQAKALASAGSFEGEGGELCRAYRSGDTGGIACRDATGWDIQREFALDGAQTTEFRQAGSEGDVMAAAQAMAAGDALDAEAEAEAKANGWR